MSLHHANMALWCPILLSPPQPRPESLTATLRFLPDKFGSATPSTKNKISKWAVPISTSDQSFITTSAEPITKLNMKEWTQFLHDEMSHVFGEQGIDPTAYDEDMKYRDPITKLDGLRWYLLNIAMLRTLFKGQCHLHWAKQTGKYEITTRWSAVMEYNFLQWRPRLVFSGNSIITINPQTNKISSQVDYWDSIKNNNHFSLEGLLDIINQFRIDETPRTLDYQVLKRTPTYEVRKYGPFVVSEMHDHMFSRSEGDRDFHGFPTPNEEKATKMRKLEGGFAAVAKFCGKPKEDVVILKEEMLRSNLVEDGLKPRLGYILSRCNNPGCTWRFIVSNEVLIWLEDFTLL